MTAFGASGRYSGIGSMAFEDTEPVAIDGLDLAYRERGTGDPVVLVHGSLSDMRTWDRQVDALAGTYRTIAYSRRFSPPNNPVEPDGSDPMEPHVDDLLGLVRATDAAPAHLIGDSWGGFISLLAAIREPSVVRSLVLQEPPVLSLFASSPPKARELLRLLPRRPRTAAAILKFGAGTVARAERAFARSDDERAMTIFAHGVLGPDVFNALPESRRQQARDNLSTLKAQLPEGFPDLPDEQVRSVECPVLLINGERSPAFFHRLGDRLEELLPRVQRITIRGASHSMHEQRPEDVNRAILRFLATGGRATEH